MALYSSVINVQVGVDLPGQLLYFAPDPTGFGNPSNLVPENFSNCNARMYVKTAQSGIASTVLTLDSFSAGGIAFISGTISPGPPVPSYPNGIQYTITKAQTIALAPSWPNQTQFWFDIYLDNTLNGTTVCLDSGPFILTQ